MPDVGPADAASPLGCGHLERRWGTAALGLWGSGEGTWDEYAEEKRFPVRRSVGAPGGNGRKVHF